MKTERKNAISEEQLGLIERFLAAYNKVDHHMRDVMHARGRCLSGQGVIVL